MLRKVLLLAALAMGALLPTVASRASAAEAILADGAATRTAQRLAETRRGYHP